MEEQNTFDGISLAPQRRKQNALRIFLLGVGCLFLFGSLALYHVESVRQRDLQEKQLAQAVQGSSCFLKGRERQAMDWIATTTATFRKLNNAESLKITEQMHLTLDAKLFLLDKEGRLLNKAREEARQTDNQEFLLDASSDLKQLQLAATVQQPASGYFQEQGRIYFGVAGKVDSGAVQHVILVLPLNSSLLRQMKQLVNADLVALSEAGLEILSKVIGAVFTEKHTESFIDGAVLRLVAFPAKNSSLQETISDGEKPIGVFLLPDVNGSSVGGVVVILPEQKEAMYLPAGITALFGVFSLAWWLALRLKAEEGSSRERRFISRRALSSRRSVDGYLHDLQAMQQKNTELLEMQRIMQKKLEERAIIVPYYQRFFQNSPVEFFSAPLMGSYNKLTSLSQ